jgi:hypothetical protein
MEISHYIQCEIQESLLICEKMPLKEKAKTAMNGADAIHRFHISKPHIPPDPECPPRQQSHAQKERMKNLRVS